MMHDARRVKALANQLIELMDRERQAVRAGDYARMEALLKRREGRMVEFAAAVEAAVATYDDSVERETERVLAAASELHRHLGAARDGVRHARERLREIDAARRSLGVYTEDGGRRPPSDPSQNKLRHA